MNKEEKRAVGWVAYALLVVMVSGFSFAYSPTSWNFGISFVVGLFGLGWFASRLEAEHQKSKNPVVAVERPGPDEEEKKWRSLLQKKGPWDP